MAYQTLVTFSDISMVKLENNTTVQLKPKIYRRYVNMFSRRKVNKLAIACLKLIIETLEQGVKYVQS